MLLDTEEFLAHHMLRLLQDISYGLKWNKIVISKNTKIIEDNNPELSR